MTSPPFLPRYLLLVLLPALLGGVGGWALAARALSLLESPRTPTPETLLFFLLLGALALTAWKAPVPGRGLRWTLRTLPFLALAFLVFHLGDETRQALREVQSRQLVRTLAVLRGREGGVQLEAAARATGYHLTRLREGRVEGTTLEDEELLGALAGIRPPPPTFPRTGLLRVRSGSFLYAVLLEGGGNALPEDAGTLLLLTVEAPGWTLLPRSPIFPGEDL